MGSFYQCGGAKISFSNWAQNAGDVLSCVRIYRHFQVRVGMHIDQIVSSVNGISNMPTCTQYMDEGCNEWGGPQIHAFYFIRTSKFELHCWFFLFLDGFEHQNVLNFS